MKTKSHIINCVLIFSLFILLPFNARAFDYIISFTGSGAATTIDSIRVMNLNAGTTELLPAGYNLHLYNISTNVSFSNENTPQLYCYRQVGAENTVLSYNATESGDFLFKIFTLDGKINLQKKFQFQKGRHMFDVQLPQGVYIAQVEGVNNSSSVRIISTSTLNKNSEINYRGVSVQNQPQKIGASEKTMLYTPGDRILYKGYSGNYCTIVTDVPVTGKTTNFEFADCTDADGNHYAIVKIGTQTWMAENLKTTKFRTGKSITNITGTSAWKDATTAAWCVYNNTVTFGEIYGLLYNWYAVNDSKNISPIGWHVASHDEWTTLANYLIANGYNYDGSVVENKIGKSLAIENFWFKSTIEGAVGNEISKNNSTGFSALPGGARNGVGSFIVLNINGFWWTASEGLYNNGIERSLSYNSVKLSKSFYEEDFPKNYGFSVRCIKD